MHPTFLPRLRRSIISTGFPQNPLRRSLLSRRRGKADRSWGVPRTQRINSSRHASYQQDLRGRCRLPWTIICSGWRCSACTFLHLLQIGHLNNIHAMHFFTNMYKTRRQGRSTCFLATRRSLMSLLAQLILQSLQTLLPLPPKVFLRASYPQIRLQIKLLRL